jgi:hypothetical protein
VTDQLRAGGKSALSHALSLVVLLILVTGINNAAAVDLGACGSKVYQRYLVPDGVCIWPNGDSRPFVCNAPHGVYVSFKEACQQHDECYAGVNQRKSSCDSFFYRSLVTLCRTSLTSDFPKKGRKACYNWAVTFNDAVRSQGCSAYQKAQISAGVANPRCK